MEFSSKNQVLTLETDKKNIAFHTDSLTLDGLLIEMAGEYEKSWVLMYAFSRNEEQLFHFRVEGYWIAYVPKPLADISPEALDFLGTVDILIIPWTTGIQVTIEKIEPRLIVTYGEQAHQIGMLFWAPEPVAKYKLKESDLSSEKTGCVIMEG